MAKKSYSSFSIPEREILFKRLTEGWTQKAIALELNRHPSTISREISRNGMTRDSYRPTAAEKHAKQETQKRRRKFKLVEDVELRGIIEEKLMQKWSPEQISGALKRQFANFPSLHISHETIYRYIYSLDDPEHKRALIQCLRQSRRRRRPRRNKGVKRSSIRNPVSIHDRPIEVIHRLIPGHWEGDLMIGKDGKSAIGTLVERVTRLTIIVSFEGNHSTREVTMAFAAALGILPPHMRSSLTYDRGTEMAGHQWFTETTNIPVFFADPYSPWQRGTNENTNGLIRDYLPKGTDFKRVSDRELKEIEQSLNIRPRKTLDFHTPEEMFTWFLQNPGRTMEDYFVSVLSSAI